MARFVKEGKQIYDTQLKRYLTSTEAWQLRKSLQLKRLKQELPHSQAEGQKDHAVMQKMMTELVQSGAIPNRRYTYDEMHKLLDDMKAQRKEKETPPPPEQADFGVYFVVLVIVGTIFFFWWYFTQGGGS